MRCSEERLHDFLREMLLIRRFEEKVEERFRAGELPGFLHVAIGQEAAEVGVCEAMEDGDVFSSTHRAHGHTLARGTTPNAVMAELYGKLEGCSHGYGGSMHLYDLERGNQGANAVVGGGLPAAVGAGLAFKLRDEPRVAVAFFGDGATNTGAFHESLNLASLWQTKTLFVCENNEWAESTPGWQHSPVYDDMSKRASPTRCGRSRSTGRTSRRSTRPRRGARARPLRRRARSSSTSRPTACTATTSATRRSTAPRTTATQRPSATRSSGCASGWSVERRGVGGPRRRGARDRRGGGRVRARNGTDPQPEDASKNVYA